jgi:hypothetical protein
MRKSELSTLVVLPVKMENSLSQRAVTMSLFPKTVMLNRGPNGIDRNTRGLVTSKGMARATMLGHEVMNATFSHIAITILKHFLKGLSKGKLLLAPKLRKSADKSLSQP